MKKKARVTYICKHCGGPAFGQDGPKVFDDLAALTMHINRRHPDDRFRFPGKSTTRKVYVGIDYEIKRYGDLGEFQK